MLTTADLTAATGAFNAETVTLSGSNISFHNTYGAGVTTAYRSASCRDERKKVSLGLSRIARTS